MMRLVSNGVADVGVGPVIVTHERYEVVAFTDTLILTR
jgi:hypothetical protein